MTIYEFKNNWNLVNPFNWKIPVHLILWYLGNLPNCSEVKNYGNKLKHIWVVLEKAIGFCPDLFIW